MKQYKELGGEYIDNLEEYVETYLRKYPEVKLHIGTDSVKNYKFATAICFEHPSAGVHYIFKRYDIAPIEVVALKMLTEVGYTIEVAEYLEEKLISYKKELGYEEHSKISILHIDVNPDPRWGSHKAYSDVVGWARGAGYRYFTKPYAWAASTAADFLCNKGKFG